MLRQQSFHVSALFVGKVGARKQIGADGGRALDAHAPAPFVDRGVVAGEQHLGDVEAAVAGRAGVLRVLEQAVVEALVDRAPLVAEHAGQRADHRVDDDHGRQLAAGEHVVAQRDDLVGQGVAALVDALVVAADEQQVLALGEACHRGAVEGPAGRGEEDDMRVGIALAGGEALAPGYFSQKEITINNFSSSTKNFYKSYHMNTKIINNNINTNNRSIEKSTEKSIDKSNKNINININSQDSTIYPSDKLISVNKSKYNKKNSRNKNICNNKYSSCENILIKENINKYKIKLNKNNNNNLTIRKSNEKKISRRKLFSLLQEFNSVKYINTNSVSNKEQNIGMPKSTRDSNLLNHNYMKQNTNINILVSSKCNFLNKKKKSEKSNKIMKQKNGYVKNKKIPFFRNDNGKENYNILFQRTYNGNFKNDNNKSIK